ncbi:Calcium and integrin-binding protein 1 [Trichoplax sp. H2]|nr:Calcium and integrin-binding protein 1 [Trichoplax sp. H2]|eukprot:RDD43302.1 Calcium and integrin-binding protein 1 [Trichoplax sp. H2]
MEISTPATITLREGMGGNSSTQITKEELENLKKSMYLSSREILECHRRWIELLRIRNRNVSQWRECRISQIDFIEDLAEMTVNPFADRICTILSSSEDRDGSMSFEDTVNLFSFFNQKAPKDLKAELAFAIYDFDGDNSIGRSDLAQLVYRLCGKARINEEELNILIEAVLDEADLDHSRTLCQIEFMHLLTHSPNFESSFCIRI